ncbi:protein kinase domain-containing protein [Actinopolymorpha pittospori]|uniref:non-specific serine/threonine protein kinase n=1 Tax=Actinopolymorpha pittospori TaxID=648752 RepID=A0A927MPK1_9ACTN|nr:protein kinase [Actinopolymorpha pittospori]MBE1603734.1 serine/threonine protein kinase [Actinopolymorpha pittospori]
MANLRVKGEYVGPGEQRTAEYLEANLPDDWFIFAGRKLPGPNRDDADLIVVGRSLVFVIEEKAWGPTVVVDDNNWYVRDDPRPNPLNRVSQVARIVASTLRERAKGYANLGPAHRVLPAVVLSHPKLQVLRGHNHDDRERIWPLGDAPAALEALDEGFHGASLGVARVPVVTYLDDLPKPAGKPKLGGYTIESRLASPGQEQAWLATDSTGEAVILKCYPTTVLAAQGDPQDFMRREYAAVNRVADLGRTWRAYPPFSDDAGELFVVPVVPPRGGSTLHASVEDGVPERAGGKLDDDLARAITVDAFRALQDIHDAGLVHRALHPKRVWLHQKRRVMFSDLNLARIEDDVSIALWATDGDMSEDFRAPECASSLALATTKSDVYSLALCLGYWLLGKDVTESAHDVIAAELQSAYPWAQPLMTALAPSAADRPMAGAVAEKLQPPPPEPEPVPATPVGRFEVGGLIADRYEIVRKLGRGGFATSWKVYDRQRELPLVLKQIHQNLPEDVRAEFQAAHALHYDYCGSVYDMHVTRPPHYLVSEYVEGESLAEEGRAFSVNELRDIAVCVLKALDYIHSRDLVHGDVTPSNVIAAPDGTSAKLIDFGLMVRTGNVPAGGTPKYAAPEVRDGKPATTASDLFGFGATMAYAMLGRTVSSLASGTYEVIAPTRAEEEAWGPEGAQLLRTCLTAVAIAPRDRPSSAGELLELVRSTRSAPGPDDAHGEELEYQVNPNVGSIRRLYRASAAGNAGNRGLDDEFAAETYVPTRLDTNLLPRVLAGELDVVLLSGNPGDGKTSLLVQLGERLKERGAQVLHTDDAGWRLKLSDRTFYAVFDASEAHGSLSSDELVKQSLEPVRTQSAGAATALIAVNDGRLHQFFADAGEPYEDWWFEIQDQIAGKDPGSSRIALVDLKRRSLAAVDSTGLANQALAALTRDDLWAKCSSCAAKVGCPIVANRNTLNGVGAEAFGELMLISHLRRRRRATFRDVRSAAAWLITGDRDCPDVHQLVRQGRNAGLMSDALAHDLAFATGSNDYLVDEWSDLDPALVPDPRVDRVRRESSAAEGTGYLKNAESAARAIYFGERLATDISRVDVRAYRYLAEFLDMLAGKDTDHTRDRLLLGISRLVGAHGYLANGLAFSLGSPDSSWAILHTIEGDSFTARVADARHQYVETIADVLVLEHGAGARLTLTLDSAEIILRAADGEIVNDPASDAIRQEIDAFVGQLGRHPSTSAQVVDSSGSVTTAAIDGVDIKFALDGKGAS